MPAVNRGAAGRWRPRAESGQRNILERDQLISSGGGGGGGGFRDAISRSGGATGPFGAPPADENKKRKPSLSRNSNSNENRNREHHRGVISSSANWNNMAARPFAGALSLLPAPNCWAARSSRECARLRACVRACVCFILMNHQFVSSFIGIKKWHWTIKRRLTRPANGRMFCGANRREKDQHEIKVNALTSSGYFIISRRVRFQWLSPADPLAKATRQLEMVSSSANERTSERANDNERQVGGKNSRE